MSKKTIDIKILDERLRNPETSLKYAKPGDAGIDVRACINEPVTIGPGENVKISLGFALNIKNPLIMAALVPRSGLSDKFRISLANKIGIIDSQYQGEVGASVANDGKNEYTINPMERIAQMIFIPVIQAELNEVDEFDAPTERDTGGWGHTDKH